MLTLRCVLIFRDEKAQQSISMDIWRGGEEEEQENGPLEMIRRLCDKQWTNKKLIISCSLIKRETGEGLVVIMIHLMTNCSTHFSFLFTYFSGSPAQKCSTTSVASGARRRHAVHSVSFRSQFHRSLLVDLCVYVSPFSWPTKNCVVFSYPASMFHSLALWLWSRVDRSRYLIPTTFADTFPPSPSPVL